WAHLALVCLAKKDHAGYRTACANLIETFRPPSATLVTGNFGAREVHSYGQPRDPGTAALVVWTCSLAPDALKDMGPVMAHARELAGAYPEEYQHARGLAAALYRAGQPEAALRQMEKALSLRKHPSPPVWLLIGMAHHHPGECRLPIRARGRRLRRGRKCAALHRHGRCGALHRRCHRHAQPAALRASRGPRPPASGPCGDRC